MKAFRGAALRSPHQREDHISVDKILRNQLTCQPTHSRAACRQQLVVVPLWVSYLGVLMDFKNAFIDNKLPVSIFIFLPQTSFTTDNGCGTNNWRMLNISRHSFEPTLTVNTSTLMCRLSIDCITYFVQMWCCSCRNHPKSSNSPLLSCLIHKTLISLALICSFK